METYKYETHLHTSETSLCAKVKAEDAVRIYHNAGYTGIIVTDHYTRRYFEEQPLTSWDKKIDLYLDGYQKAFAEGQRLGLDVHLGIEITFNENGNDYLIYGFDKEFLLKYKELYKLGLEALRELTADMGIIIIQAHPYRVNMIPACPSLIDGMEIYNGNNRHKSSNYLAEQYASENGLKMLSGSDFHRPEDVAKGGIIVGNRIKPNGFVEIVMQDRIIDYIRA